MTLQFKRIIQNFQFDRDSTRFPSIVKSLDIKNKALCKAIESYAEQNKRAFTWRDIQDYLLTNNEVRIDINIIRQILKKRLIYSFKRCSSRPLKLNHRIQDLKKTLFSIKLLNTIRKSTLLANIDESVISNTAKINYSWNRIGSPSNFSTIIYSGSISIVTEILSNDLNITGIRKGTITSNSFVKYIDHMFTIWSRF